MQSQQGLPLLTPPQREASETKSQGWPSRYLTVDYCLRLASVFLYGLVAASFMLQRAGVARLQEECKASEVLRDCDEQFHVLWWAMFFQLAAVTAVGVLEFVFVRSDLHLIGAVCMALATAQLVWVAEVLLKYGQSELYAAADLRWTGIGFMISAVANLLLVFLIDARRYRIARDASLEMSLLHIDVDVDHDERSNETGKGSMAGKVLPRSVPEPLKPEMNKAEAHEVP